MLEADLFRSFRSPYSYFGQDRIDLGLWRMEAAGLKERV